MTNYEKMRIIFAEVLLLCLVLAACSDYDGNNFNNSNNISHVTNSKILIRGRVISNGAGISGVVVSDGYKTILTDENGYFTMTINSDEDFIFISVPSSYDIPNEKGKAKFYEKEKDIEEGSIFNSKSYSSLASSAIPSYVSHFFEKSYIEVLNTSYSFELLHQRF